MSKENNISFFNNNSKEEKLLKKMNKTHNNNSMNLRKKKLFKRIQLINSNNNFYKKDNNFPIYLNRKENNKVNSFSKTNNINISNFTTIKKPNEIDKSNNKTTLDYDLIKTDKNNNKKMKMSHLYIDSYNKKVKFSLPINFKNNCHIIKKMDKNITSINYIKNENKKGENNINLEQIKKDLKILSRDAKIKINKTFNKNRSKSISYNIKNNINNNELIKYFKFSSKKYGKKSQIFFDRINTINSPLYLSKKKNYSLKIKKQNLKCKYSNNFVKDNIYKQILSNPNLKILYQTNENRIKKMIKSQSKKNKTKFTILKYQKNLMNNSISPLNDEQKYKIMKSFSKINNYIITEKKINLQRYLNEVQKKEKKIIHFHNKLNQRYINNIKKIGLSPEKHLLKMVKVSFKDIFKKK